MKNIAIFFDGSWNTPADRSNVYRLYRLVDDLHGNDHLTLYVSGVGTAEGGLWSSFSNFLGGAFGDGLSENIVKAYQWLGYNYEAGDKLFLFGFSRGAYSARSLAGLIRNSGVLRRSEIARAREAYEIYRDRNPVDTATAQEFRRDFAREIDIEFIGVWDTVGALGIPIDGIALPGFKNYYQFHNTTLSSRVQGAYQALALNELRAAYSPCVWTLDPGETRTLPVEQRWFLGAHSNVGGGYPGDTLCNPSCRWIQAMAQTHGLRFVSDWKVGRADYDMSPRDSYAEFIAQHPDARKFITKQARTLGLGVNETIDPIARQLIADKPTMFNTYTQSFREGVRRLRAGAG